MTTTTEIYNLANELTEQEVLNIVKGWENDDDTKSLDTYHSLVRLGDSMQLAKLRRTIQIFIIKDIVYKP